jgi:hypothetical protein
MLNKRYSAEPLLDWFTLVRAAAGTVLSSRWPQNWRRFKFLVLFTVLWPILKAVSLPCLMLDYLLYPGFHKLPIKEPLFIVGNWRTGSTMLYRNIARDTENIACFTFLDALLPAICMKRAVARLQRVDRWLGGWGARVGNHVDDLFLAEYSRIHPMGFMLPEEDEHALLVDLCSASMFELFPMVKRFRRLFFVDQEMPRLQREFVMQRYAKLVRRQLYHQGPHKRFVAKNPLFTHKIQSLAAHFPDAKFVHLVRNPVNTVVSTASLFHFVWHETGALAPDDQDMDTVLEFCHEGYQHAGRCGESLDDERWVDVRFAELIADPEGTIRMLWTRFGWEVNPDLDQVLAAAGRRQKKWRNKHRYTAEQYGLTAAGIYDEFRYVYDQYDFPAPAETAEA